jgi:hypothetical protein
MGPCLPADSSITLTLLRVIVEKKALVINAVNIQGSPSWISCPLYANFNDALSSKQLQLKSSRYPT